MGQTRKILTTIIIISMLSHGFSRLLAAQINIKTQEVSCHGGTDGSIQVVLTGASNESVFLYKLYAGKEEIQIKNSGHTCHFDSLKAKQYQLKILGEANTIISWQDSILVEQPARLSIDDIICSSALSCSGCQDAALTASVSGGTKPYTHRWYQETGPETRELLSKNVSLQDIGEGKYIFELDDALQCGTTYRAIYFFGVNEQFKDSILTE
jgi:hypothetical protein